MQPRHLQRLDACKDMSVHLRTALHTFVSACAAALNIALTATKGFRDSILLSFQGLCVGGVNRQEARVTLRACTNWQAR